MRNLSAKWFPKSLKAYQECQQCHSSKQILNILARCKWISLAIGDHGRNLVISLWCPHKATINAMVALRLTLSENKIRVKKFRWNSSGLNFLDLDGILLFDYIPKGRTNNAECPHFSCYNWWIFWRKTQCKFSKVSCPWTTISRISRHVQPRRNWPSLSSSDLITHAVRWI